jgi:hypothetical protein
MEAVEKHFRETHKENIIKPVESHTLGGAAARALRCQDLARLVRSACDDQRRFPLQIATVLSQQFASHGLQFFKVNKTFTHVCVARPHYLDMTATPVSGGVKRIVEYIDANPKCTRRQLVEALAPSPAAPLADPAAPPQPESTQPTAEQTAVIADLHWLIHQGHVIEFANGILETAKKPLPKPPKPEPTPAAAPAEPAPPAEAPIPDQPAAAEPAPEPAAALVAGAPQPESPPPPAEASAAEAPLEVPANTTPAAATDEPAARPLAATSGESPS